MTAIIWSFNHLLINISFWKLFSIMPSSLNYCTWDIFCLGVGECRFESDSLIKIRLRLWIGVVLMQRQVRLESLEYSPKLCPYRDYFMTVCFIKYTVKGSTTLNIHRSRVNVRHRPPSNVRRFFKSFLNNSFCKIFQKKIFFSKI